MNGPVVVGVNSSQPGTAVVEAAAQAAERLGVELRLAYALEWPADHVPPGIPPWDRGGNVLKGKLGVAEQWARDTAPHVRITQEVLMGSPVAVLDSESRDASLTVVGSHSPVRRAGLWRRSVAEQLAALGRSPLLVVRGRHAPTGPVVLAGGHTDGRRTAAAFAFAEASARGADLVVLEKSASWSGQPRNGFVDALSVLKEEFPDVTMRRTRVRGGMGQALVEASTSAQLVVVGARGSAGFAGVLRNLASQVAVRRANCPVAVLRSDEE